jgi:hypothetical protein
MTEPSIRACSFCGGAASGSGAAQLLVQSKDGLAAVCGKCIEAHAELLHEVEKRRRRDSEAE